MMKLQGLIATARSLFGGCRQTFGFIVLLFAGVALFPSPDNCGSCVFPSSCHLMDLGCQAWRGWHALNASRPVPSAIPLLPSFLLLLLFLFLFLVVFSLIGCLPIVIF